MKLFLISFLALSSVSCLSAEAETSICKSDLMRFSITPPEAGTHLPTATFSIVQDLTNELSSIQDIGEIKLSVSKSRLYNETGDMSWLRNIEITMEATADKDSFPVITFAKEDVSTSASEFNFKVVASPEEVNKYFFHGEVQFNFKLEGDVPTDVKLGSELCLDANLKVKKLPK